MAIMKSWHEVSEDLTDVAMGRASADLVIRNGKWVNVHSGEIISGTDIATISGRIAYVGPDANHTIGTATQVIDAADRYLVPGLCDAHMHVESGMVTVTEFARAVIPHGTTSMFIDPHEIANVLGLTGVRLMHDEALTLPINVFVQMPSCVPSAPGLETSGASIGPDEVAEAMQWPGIIGLGEMMNFPGVFTGDKKMHAEMARTREAGKVIGGHYASPDLGLPFHGYLAGGPADDHECTRMEEAIERVRRGMKVMMRLGSAWYDVAELVRAVTERGLDSRNFILCTDDSHSGTLVNDGHMNRVVRHAIAQGLNPVTAIQMATLNAAEHFGLERELGSIAPGRRADIIITGSLAELPIEMVIAGGQVLAAGGRLTAELSPYKYPANAKQTVHLGTAVTPAAFEVAAPGSAPSAGGGALTGSAPSAGGGALAGSAPSAGGGALSLSVRVRSIGVIENQAPTRALEVDLPVHNGIVLPDHTKDTARLALIERHRGTGGVTNGFVTGFGFAGNCAVASTVAHDSHHLIVVGTRNDEMALAANRLAEVGGGVAVFRDGKEIALVELAIAGLMSVERAEVVAEKAARMTDAFRECGCTLNNAFMQLSLLALVVIPELRISDRGIVDVREFRQVDLFV